MELMMEEREEEVLPKVGFQKALSSSLFFFQITEKMMLMTFLPPLSPLFSLSLFLSLLVPKGSLLLLLLTGVA